MSMRPDQRKTEPSPGVPARLAAMRLLDAVLRRGLPLEAELERAGSGLPPQDRALAHAIAAEALRWLPDLDALIDSATARALPPDAKARFALRLALAQALRLGTPGHAAISTILPLLDGGPRRLVHGVFGTLMRRGVGLPDQPSLPPLVTERWRGSWGEAALRAARTALAAPPPLDLSLKDSGATAEWTERLGGSSLAEGHVRLPRAGAITSVPGFEEGAWWVQDVAASVPARLTGDGAGTALDLCAAPGGKTLQLAAVGWQVTAIDNSESRIERLRDNLGRAGLDAEVIAADVMAWTPDAAFDAVLLDAPCSATGIFRRHPDVLHRMSARLIAERAELQAAMLARAADWVKPGGQLVYAVCSLEPEEGEAILDAFLGARADYRVEPATAAELPTGIVPDALGRVRVLPGGPGVPGGADGFFIARLRRAN
jgi:16S rRNA (cytosine967-C5)-methyltransferase